MLQTRYVTKNQKTQLYLTGPMDEKAAKVLNDILPHMAKQVHIDFSEVEYFNSLGIRTWVNFLRILVDGRKVFYERCTMDLVQQINMMPILSKGVEVLSFLAVFSCESCGHEQSALMDVSLGRKVLKEQMLNQPCQSCKSTLTPEEDPDSVLFFLQS